MLDLVIANGLLVTADSTSRADLGIDGHRITAIGSELPGREVIDASGLLVLPGAVDAGHENEGYERAEHEAPCDGKHHLGKHRVIPGEAVCRGDKPRDGSKRREHDRAQARPGYRGYLRDKVRPGQGGVVLLRELRQQYYGIVHNYPGKPQRAAIVLTYDDSAPSQLQYAVPALNEAGLKGTFFLTGANMPPESMPRWRAVAEAGHELANHTIHHPCNAGTYEAPARYTTEAYDVDTMLNEIRTMNAFLTAIDGRPLHAYGAPCGHTTAGGVDFYGPLMAAGIATYYRDEGVPPSAVQSSRRSPALRSSADAGRGSGAGAAGSG